MPELEDERLLCGENDEDGDYKSDDQEYEDYGFREMEWR